MFPFSECMELKCKMYPLYSNWIQHWLSLPTGSWVRTLRKEWNALDKCLIRHWQLKKSNLLPGHTILKATHLQVWHPWPQNTYFTLYITVLRPHQIVFLLNNLILFWYIILFAVSSFYKHNRIPLAVKSQF